MMQFTPKTIDAYNLFHKGILALARAERNGICCDVDYCEKMEDHLTRQIARLEKQMKQSDLMKRWRGKYGPRLKLGSGQQLADILFNEMGLESVKDTEEGSASTDEEALDALAVTVPELYDFLRIRKLTKARDTYLKGFRTEQVDGVIHTNFNLHFARSFRPSTDSPNLANIPKRNPEIQRIVRRAIRPRPGHKILSADFKGIEVGISCCYNLDPVLISYVKDKTKDMHRDMAGRLYLVDMLKLHDDLPKMYKMLRHSGKNEFVFPQFYGDWWKSCAGALWTSAHNYVVWNDEPLIEYLRRQHNIRTLEQFEHHVEDVENWFWKKNFKVYDQWKTNWWDAYCKQGYFDTLTGFRCSAIMDRKQACNYPVQGSAFHCMLQCIVWMDEDSIKENWDSYICNQIYDDLMMDVHPKEERMIVDRMKLYMTERLPEHFKWINVPMGVEIESTKIDGTWYDKSEDYLFQ